MDGACGARDHDAEVLRAGGGGKAEDRCGLHCCCWVGVDAVKMEGVMLNIGGVIKCCR